MNIMRNSTIVILFVITSVTYTRVMAGDGKDIKVGVGRKVITPKPPIWLNGYASPARLSPATGVTHDLWAKALVFEETPQNRFVIITTDLLGISHEVSVDVVKKLEAKYGLTRSQVMMNSSHTHSGPMVWPAASMFDYTPEDMRAVYQYTLSLTDSIIAAVDMAMQSLSPMEISSGKGTASFAGNRRNPKWERPVDHEVPVLKLASPDGVVRAILFGYACHNTTLDGDYMEVSGDYAGYAQLELEDAYPGATALFFQGCCGDIDPIPRGTKQNAIDNGKELSQAVQKVLSGSLKAIHGPIKSEFATTSLDFAPYDIESFRSDMLGTDPYKQRRAGLMLKAYNKGWETQKYSYPVLAVRFGKDLSILALSGEVVVDYSLWAKKEYQNENLFVAGYSNEVLCYIPSLRVLKEGGYEANSSMIYYQMPGPFDENVQTKVFDLIHRVMKANGVKPSGK